MIWIENFGQKLKQERKSWGMSKSKLAKLSHLDEETIEDIEKGKIENPNFFDMLNICQVLDTSVYFYIKEEGKIND